MNYIGLPFIRRFETI